MCCSLFAIIFSISMFIAACVKFNKSNLLKINFPTDQSGRTCGYDLPGHPYLYLLSPFSTVPYNPLTQDLSLRLCVSSCPTANDTLIECHPTRTLSCSDPRAMLYSSHPEVNRLGGYCIPDDTNTYNKAMYNYNLKEKVNFMRAYDTVRMSVAIALGLGVLMMVFVQCWPRLLGWVVVILAVVAGVVLAVLMIVDNGPSLAGNKGLAVAIGVLLVILAVGLALNLFWLKYSIRISGIFLEYSTRFLSTNKFIYWWIPIFLLMSLGLVALTMFEALAFSSSVAPVLDHDDVYWNGPGVTFSVVLVFVQFVWGISFLRDACK